MMIRHVPAHDLRAERPLRPMNSSLASSPRPVRFIDPANYTPGFAWHPARRGKAAELYCERVSLESIADAAETPAYVYSRAAIEKSYRNLDVAFGTLPHRVCYAVKANSNLALLSVLARLGASFDIVSGGELDRLRRLKIPGNRIVFSGVGKTREEIRAALNYSGAASSRGRKGRGGILLFNVESAPELDLLISEASRHVAAGGTRPSVAIRVNPDVAAGGHPHISTGQRHHKFGIDWRDARELYLQHKNSPAIAWRGISAHIGSQIVSLDPYRRALRRVASYVRDLAQNGVRLEFLDIGGGLGIRYTDESPLIARAFAKALAQIAKPLGCTLLVEPGRAIVGPAGVLLTRVLYLKESRGKTFVIVDAAMNDLIRPALYGAHHPITAASRKSGTGAKERLVDIVGPVCESGDFFLHDAPLPEVQSGDLLVIWAAGAYSFAQSSNYNTRRRAAEVLVEGSRFRIVRRRETYDDLVRGERLP
jgi:diaminopimelate decarboxylase